MKRYYSDVTFWLRFSLGIVDRELWLAARVVSELSSEALWRPEPCEGLASVILILNRERDDLERRVKEQFFKPTIPAEAEAIAEPFRKLAEGDLAKAVSGLRGSVDARVRLYARHRDHFDGHTRLILRLQECLHEDVVLPTLRTVARQLSREPTDAVDFEPLYAPHLPAPRAHPDDFLRFTVERSA